MTEKQVREVLRDYIREDGGLYSLDPYLVWKPGDSGVTLDGDFEKEELEAIFWWLKLYSLS